MVRYKNKKIVTNIIVAVMLAAVVYLSWPTAPASPKAAVKPTAQTPSSTTSQQFNKQQYSINQASSLWAIVNKGRSLPSTYTPAGLTVPKVPLRLSASAAEMSVRPEMAAALQTMFSDAKGQGLNFMLASGYRSYAAQSAVYSSYAAQSGAAQADTFSARPGHSEHQTGLAADVEPVSRVCEVEQCFENTPEGQWLAANSYKYGLIVRYQKGKENLTGYEYEPWHVRFVGTDLAAQIHASGQTLEQFFGLPAAVDYSAEQFKLE
jgi:D-alanyl-D-alanine carboxypeptidase